MNQLKKYGVAIGIVLAVAGAIAYIAYRTRAVLTPRRRWRRFDHPDAIPLDAATCQHLQGIYTIEKGADFFGDSAILKYSYTVEEGETIHRLSLFCEKNGTYIIAEAKKHVNVILLSGYWRKAAANGTGIVWLVIKGVDRDSLPGQLQQRSLMIRGTYGNKEKEPTEPLVLRYQHPLPKKRPLDIIAHRGGARNVDFLPVSENTISMMKMAAQLGATGVEIDVRMTKDGVPVIFHDSFLSIHTVKGKLYGGLIHNYDLKELQSIELRKGGRIPTLKECLHTILYETPLETVWLDIKKECDLYKIHKLQEQYLQRAETISRRLNIYIGIPDTTMLKCFKELDDYKNIPSLIELEPGEATRINAEVWAP
ncbi:MAG TPA: glycerophosphodiester phosphodiesterase family protein, partial [Flavipsychrobacter sp.]|nr:glycerophosphodiester phosphodiesterase family protein [Flavipsychrobacter sp.]